MKKRTKRLAQIAIGGALLGSGLGAVQWVRPAHAALSAMTVAQLNALNTVMTSESVMKQGSVTGTYDLLGLSGRRSAVTFSIRYGAHPAMWSVSTGNNRTLESRFSDGKMEDIDHTSKTYEIHPVVAGGVYTGELGQYLSPKQYAGVFLDPNLVTTVAQVTFDGRSATEVKGNTPAFLQMQAKGDESTFDMVVDNQSGILLKFAAYHPDGTMAESAVARSIHFGDQLNDAKAAVEAITGYSDVMK